MQLSHAVTNLESAVETQLRVVGPEIAEAGAQLMAALKPSIKESMMEVINMAVAEISSQLDTQTIDIKLVDGDPDLVVNDDPTATAPPPPPPPSAEDVDEARITVRLPGYLKDLIANEAESAGDSINSYVVDVLNSKTHKKRGSHGTHHKTTFRL